MYVKQKSDTENKLLVRRAQNNTIAASHVSGTNVLEVNESDNQQVDLGDDFGFDGGFI